MLFTVFAFIVLLGTIFPLLVEAFQNRRTVVGAPYFDRLSMPLGLVLLFLMGVAPVLPWRKASGELLRQRLFWPAWMGAGAIVLAVVVGADGWAPLVAFGFGGFAAGSALRQLALATRRQGLGGFVGRANGGMVVHIGVIIIAVALAASNSFTHSATLELETGRTVAWGGHTFELTSVDVRTNDNESKRVLGRQRRARRWRHVSSRHHDLPQHGCRCRHAVGAHRTHGGHLSDPRSGRRRRRQHRHDPGVRQADDPVALDRRLDHGDRHAARGVPRQPPSPGDRSGVGSGGRARAGGGTRAPTPPAPTPPDVDGETVPV